MAADDQKKKNSQLSANMQQHAKNYAGYVRKLKSGTASGITREFGKAEDILLGAVKELFEDNELFEDSSDLNPFSADTYLSLINRLNSTLKSNFGAQMNDASKRIVVGTFMEGREQMLLFSDDSSEKYNPDSQTGLHKGATRSATASSASPPLSSGPDSSPADSASSSKVKLVKRVKSYLAKSVPQASDEGLELPLPESDPHELHKPVQESAPEPVQAAPLQEPLLSTETEPGNCTPEQSDASWRESTGSPPKEGISLAEPENQSSQPEEQQPLVFSNHLYVSRGALKIALSMIHLDWSQLVLECQDPLEFAEKYGQRLQEINQKYQKQKYLNKGFEIAGFTKDRQTKENRLLISAQEHDGTQKVYVVNAETGEMLDSLQVKLKHGILMIDRQSQPE